jgi:transcription-repair coupling factor (superfamily II helicase)
LGQVDVVIGTHRLLQNDVVFNDLGLVVIDEEQRFGVRHKQRFKELRASVDILTMTATPIPRTLYFSLSGLRNLSTIVTAPAERLPITTVVAQYDPALIQAAMTRELERKGQVYFLHNRVQTIERVARGLRAMMPGVRFGVAHGQMAAGALEEVMAQFTGGNIDVLVCTTIIESGLDIPNANTIIIDRADRFGLAELYQLRGRVGRYHHQAYAYLLLPPMGALPDNARQRLAAIRRYTHLGAGFKLALRDLEIRGAGNILGTEQSGHIAAVGFDLYCKLLQTAVARLEHRPESESSPVPVNLDTLVFAVRDRSGKELAAIPADYVGDENVRVGCYRRLNEAKSIEDVDRFAREIKDRFGPLPAAARNLFGVTRVRLLARAAGIRSVAVRERRVLLGTSQGMLRDGRRRPFVLESETAAEQLRELADLLTGLPVTEAPALRSVSQPRS